MLQGSLLHKLFHVNPEPMTLSRLDDGFYVEVNMAFLRIFGYTRDEVVGHTAHELGIWLDEERDRAHITTQVKEQGYVIDYEARFRTKGGETVRFLLGASRIDDEGGPFLLIVGRNITDLRRAEAALRESQNRYRALTENLPIGILIAQDGVIRYANPASLELVGYEREEVIGKSFLPLIEAKDRRRLSEQHRERMLGNESPTCYDLRVVRKDGIVRFGRMHSSAITWEGRPAGLVAFSDVTAEKLAEQKVTELALHDIITGLPNRLLLADRSHQAIVAAKRQGTGLALIYLDLDGFKSVNDTFGHEAGDDVLKAVAERLRNHTRETDTAARVGGDEFVVLVQNVTDCANAMQIAAKIVAAINHPIVTAAGEHRVGASVGISMFPEDGSNLDCLMRNADQAMYLAKRSGRNNVRCYGR